LKGVPRIAGPPPYVKWKGKYFKKSGKYFKFKFLKAKSIKAPFLLIKNMNKKIIKMFEKELREVRKIRNYRKSTSEIIEERWIRDRIGKISYDMENYDPWFPIIQ